MHKIFAKTLFLGKKTYFLPECHSTNSFGLNLISEGNVMEGTVISTARQTHGKGQRGNSWECEPDKNITMSVILKPSFITPAQQFSLHLVCSLAVHDTFFGTLGHKLKVKWPNDILYESTKICGILVENVLRGNNLEYSVIGIGLNVNQVNFKTPNATSLQEITGDEYQLEMLMEQILINLESRYLMLKQGKKDELIQQYYSRLYKYQEAHPFQHGEDYFTGKIQGIDEYGRLRIQHGETEQCFDFKEVRFL